MNDKVTIVGIAGGTASGKTTIVRMIKEKFGDDIVVISHDSYYKAHNDLSYEDRSRLNYDHPEAFDTALMIEDIKKLKNNEAIDMPVYDYTIHNRSDATVHIVPKKLIIIEGFMILENKELRDLMDIKVFVETDADERLLRRIRRDMVERARSIDSILTQYIETVKPMHEQFVEPSKKYADIIIPRGGENITGITILEEHLKHMMD
ncbi:uridine kinase [Butyrivibrio sp. INlla18]|uniref:Uridine kinase n=2 Tax=Butyrivibrio hungatei TaxID=185008 RepID=A0A1D9NZA3_9FIRM|nr:MULTISPECIES: uridine kinase [Butyrivibrio]AOZ95549.1 uridine kinase Udk [Butyrivibrio hungatei]MBE5841943.1 uridine kinase [Butyrivibrio sp.]SDA69617.1 uridine kinase [Butyrivibrio sp. INlla18]SHN64155.1 uridine kinase [Butyrivibrio hungatei DSM 14810]